MNRIDFEWYKENIALQNELSREYPAVYELINQLMDKSSLSTDTIKFFDRFSSAIVLFELMDTKEALDNLHRLTNEPKELDIIKRFLIEYNQYIEEV